MTTWDPDGAGPQPALLIVGGNFTHAGDAGGPRAKNIVAWNGVSLQALGAGITNGPNLAYVDALATYNGDLIAAGYFADAGGQPCASIARWDGASWHPLGSGMGSSTLYAVHALTVFNGELIAAGTFETAGGTPCLNIARWNGSIWRPLGTGLDALEVRALGVYNNELIAGGNINAAGGVSVANVARWNGSTWQAMGAGIDAHVNAFAIFKNELIAAANTPFGNPPAHAVRRWDGSAWAPVVGGVAAGSSATSLAVFNNELIVGGYFSEDTGSAGNYVARWNGITWGALQTGTDPYVNALATYNGELFAGGLFERAGSQTVESIARWSGTIWRDMPGVSSGPGGTVMALTPWSGGMVMGGQFQLAANNVPGDSTLHLAYFDGTTVSALEPWFGSTGITWVAGMATAAGPGSSEDLIIAGRISSVGGVSVNNIARINDTDGAGWRAMGAGFNGDVDSVSRFIDGVYAGGRFTTSGATTVNGIARWDGAAWRAVGPGPVKGVNGHVYAMKSFNTSATSASLVVGGGFSTAGGNPANSIATYSANVLTGQSSWAPLGAGLNGMVLAIEYFNGSIYAAGAFTASGATPLNHIARWDGSAWVPVGTGTNDVVKALTVSNGTLVVGGDFSTAGGVDARSLARWNGSNWAALAGHTDGRVHALATLQDEIHVGGAFENVRNGVLHSPIWARFSEHGTLWIAEHPQSAVLPCRAHFGPDVAIAQGYGGLVYQWRKDGVPLVDGPTGTGSTIVGAGGNFGVLNVSLADEGVYDCVISNGCGSVTSLPATLTVNGVCLRGDMNCDGTVNNFDIDPFVLAVSNPAGYLAAFPSCLITNGDANGDNVVNNFDIDAFIALLTGP